MIKAKLIPIYKRIILELSQTSTCDRAQVGAILTIDDRIVASGYNGSIYGDVHCNVEGHLMVDGHCIRTIHAENNVIAFCAKRGIPTAGASLMTSRFPCQICTKLLRQSGVVDIYYVEDYRNSDNPFQDKVRMIKV